MSERRKSASDHGCLGAVGERRQGQRQISKNAQSPVRHDSLSAEEKLRSGKPASKINRTLLSLQVDTIVRSSTSVDEKVIQNNQAPLLTRVTLSCADFGMPSPSRA